MDIRVLNNELNTNFESYRVGIFNGLRKYEVQEDDQLVYIY